MGLSDYGNYAFGGAQETLRRTLLYRLTDSTKKPSPEARIDREFGERATGGLARIAMSLIGKAF